MDIMWRCRALAYYSPPVCFGEDPNVLFKPPPDIVELEGETCANTRLFLDLSQPTNHGVIFSPAEW
jgi:hypothetical protein